MRALLLMMCLVALLPARPALAGTHHLVRFSGPSGTSRPKLETLQFSPDGSVLAVATTSGLVSFIDAPAGKKVGEHKQSVFSMAFSRDGSRLLMIGTRGTTLLDMQLGIPLDRPPYREPNGAVGARVERQDGKVVVAALPEGGPLAATGQIAVGDEIIGVGQGKNGPMADVTGGSVQRVTQLLTGIPGGWVRVKTLPAGTIEDRTVTVRRALATKQGSRTVYEPFEPVEVTDNLVWCIQDGAHAFFDTQTGGLLSTFLLEARQNRRGWRSLAPDAKTCAFLGSPIEGGDRDTYLIEVVDVGQREQVAVFGGVESDNAAVFGSVNVFWGFDHTPDGAYLLVGNWNRIQVLSAETGELERRIEICEGEPTPRKKNRPTGKRTVESFDVSAQGMLAVGDYKGTVRLFDFASGDYLTTLPKRPDDDDVVQGIAFSPDGQWLVYYNNSRLHSVDVSEHYRKEANAAADSPSGE